MNRVGIGYDVHKLVDGRLLILGGVIISHDRGLLGHSDADVLSHAIADAVLGALGEPDIGHWFPPADATIEGISSLLILGKCAELVREKGATIINIDCTLIAEKPKIRPYVDQMKVNIAGALSIRPDQVGVKATTNEHLGFLGRQEGMAAMAVASVDFPPA